MVEPLTPHPAADRVTAEAIVVEQDRSVVPLSNWIADAAVTAGASSRVLQLLTPADSRITYPLELLLRDTQAEWIVRDGPGRFRDGIAGYVVQWNGVRFVPDLDAQPAEPLPPVAGSGDLAIQITAVHRAAETLELGMTAETVITAITGAPPTGWGVAEPATQPWSRREITAHCRERAPGPSRVVVVGSGIVGQLYADRLDTGVLEQVQLSGPPAGVVRQEDIEEFTDEVAGRVRVVIVAAHPDRLNGLRGSKPSLPELPYGILLGHEVIAEHGVMHAEQAPAARVRIIGTGKRRAAWYRLDAGPARPYETLHAVLRHFGLPDPQP
ncbi:hypothetical protein FNH05_02765 [Amycolatopsis rhizosphaerae]|uniref:Uncharacterized protein n=1 Tax=Amycolatopsis rhizosphaerae TaxID=2053003 RepID=A0A558DKT1_9PSEU|nr:DUF6177 family protein [Amycolatopsis rhizosphaerae]TVT61604.1 hypothetical protein FNH05_02765 [Amycolatopsis rhizosphaerae]